MIFIRRGASLVRFCRALVSTAIASATAQRGAFLMQVGLMALNNAIFFTFWIALFHRVPRIRGYALPDMAVLYGVVAAGVGLATAIAGGAPRLAQFIHEGELDSLLSQPKPTLLYAIGRRSIASGIGDVASGIAMISLSGLVGWSRLPVVVLAVLVSAVVCTAACVLMNSIAFWFGRMQMASRQLFESLITFSLYPEPLFGGPIRLLLFTLIPAGFVGYVPAKVVRAPSAMLLLELAGAAIVYCAAASFVFERGLRAYSSGSRFELNG